MFSSANEWGHVFWRKVDKSRNNPNKWIKPESEKIPTFPPRVYSHIKSYIDIHADTYIHIYTYIYIYISSLYILNVNRRKII